MDPGMAEAYWSLADLKNYSFSDAEIEAMQHLLTNDRRDRSNAAQLHFALGKAFEQREQYADAFAHYARGNALRRLDAPFDIEHFERRTARIRAFFDEEFFAERAGSGNPDPAPIFIVGLPRSGSTLVEQILASHSRVEGTMELPNIINITHQFDDMAASRDGYPETVGTAPVGLLTALGSRYLEETAPLRSGREHFTDKLPNNFSHIGLIHAILPHATIIDARRHPMDCCFSTFKQHFAEGQTFSYDLDDLGRYYRCYLSLMDHWDAVLPGKVLHRSVRGPRARPGSEHPPPPRSLPAAVRGRLPLFSPDAAVRAHRERRTSAPADLHLGCRPLAALREGTSTAATGARRQPGALLNICTEP